jgi:hypothetical protein
MSPPSNRSTTSQFGRLVAAPLALFRAAAWTRQLVVVLVAMALLVAGSIAVWGKVRTHVQSQSEYLVPLSDMEITPTPAWIHADIRSEVIRDAGLPAKVSILDDQVAKRLSNAFALHPWIARVDGVQNSYPARIRVNLTYRKPVAMVVVYGGLLPVDVDGVLLPTEDFTPQDAQQYPRVIGISSSPLGPIGTHWGDAMVEAGAKLAELLGPQWQSLQLHHILVSEQTDPQRGTHVELVLVTRGSAQFIWGSPIGQEADEEQGSASKLKRLTEFAASGNTNAAPENDREPQK